MPIYQKHLVRVNICNKILHSLIVKKLPTGFLRIKKFRVRFLILRNYSKAIIIDIIFQERSWSFINTMYCYVLYAENFVFSVSLPTWKNCNQYVNHCFRFKYQRRENRFHLAPLCYRFPELNFQIFHTIVCSSQMCVCNSYNAIARINIVWLL